jgi:glycosyltransferase involved in cell wall biosynthesis
MRQRKWKKWIAWELYHKRHVASSNVIHATSIQEADDIRAMHLRPPIAVIPNGVALPENACPEDRVGEKKRLLFLGRIHPVKGLANLLQAWYRIGPLPDWEMVLVGPDNGGHRRVLELLVKKLGIVDTVRFVGAVSECDKWQWYQNSDLFVLPSFSENFSVSVAEALASGLPVVTTTGTPWQEVRERSCGWWVEPSVEALSNALSQALALTDDERHVMGVNGSTWARSRFSWQTVAEELHSLYAWLAQGGTAPRTVRFKSAIT